MVRTKPSDANDAKPLPRSVARWMESLNDHDSGVASEAIRRYRLAVVRPANRAWEQAARDREESVLLSIQIVAKRHREEIDTMSMRRLAGLVIEREAAVAKVVPGYRVPSLRTVQRILKRNGYGRS